MIDLLSDLIRLVLFGGLAIVALGDAAKHLPLSPRYPYRLAFHLCIAVLALGGIFRLGNEAP